MSIKISSPSFTNANETDPLSLHLDQTTPQTFTNLAGGTGLMKVTAGLLGLDTNTYITSSALTPYALLDGTNQPFTDNIKVKGTNGKGVILEYTGTTLGEGSALTFNLDATSVNAIGSINSILYSANNGTPRRAGLGFNIKKSGSALGELSEVARFDNDGNLGIGTTTPTSLLDVAGNITGLSTLKLGSVTTDETAKYGYMVNRHYTNSEEPMLGFFAGSTINTNYVWYGGGSGSYNAATQLSFYTAANNTTLTGTERMRIDSAGLVSVGTAGTGRLNVTGSTDIVQFTVKANATQTSDVLNALNSAGNKLLSLSSDGALTVSGASTTVANTNTVGSLEFYTYDVSTIPNRTVARIKAVAEGDYVGTDNAKTAITFETHGTSGDSSEKMRITNAGNVGIGTTAPSAKLHTISTTEQLRLGYDASNYMSWTVGSTNLFDMSLGTTLFFHNRGAKDYTFIGAEAGSGGAIVGVAGNGSVGIGYRALKALANGINNVAIGNIAGQAITDGNYNVCMGTAAGAKLTTGQYNHYLGYYAGYNNQTGSYATAIGSNAAAGIGTSTGYFVSIGGEAGRFSGTGCVNIGYEAGRYTTAGYNVFIGYACGTGTSGQSTGGNNIGIGMQALTSLLTGTSNTSLGYKSGYSLTDGGSNVFIGYQAGYRQTTNSNLLIIDNQARASTAVELTNSILYGVMASAPANQTLRINGRTGINIDPTAELTLPAGTATAGTAPLKFTSGTSLTAPEAGAVEFTTDDYYATITTGTARKGIILNDGANLTSGRVPFATTNGRLMDSANITWNGTVLGVTGSVSASTNVLTPIIKTDTSTPTDLTITTGAAKTLVLTQPTYEEIRFYTTTGKVPASNAPTWEAFTTNTSAYAFSVDDYMDLTAEELPHWWVEGTVGDLHIHFANKTAQSSGANQYAKFTVYVSVADINGAWSELSPFTAEYTIATGTSALKHLYLDMGDITLTGYHLGGLMTVRVKRIAATTGTEYADDVYVSQVGVHLKKDRLGSRSEALA